MRAIHAPRPLVPLRGEVRDYGRILLGLVVVAFGLLFLLESAGTLDADRAIDHWWPSVIVAMGLFQLAERSRPPLLPILVTAAGTVLLLVSTEVVSGDVWDYAWPIAIIAVGIVILARWRGAGTVRAAEHGDDVVLASGIFGGPTVATSSQSFRGGSLTAIFGGVTLDLRQALPAPEGASITATAAFGGIDILVPRGWRVALDATPIFGGAEDKTDHGAGIDPDAPLLRIDALSVFGGLEVKHEK